MKKIILLTVLIISVNILLIPAYVDSAEPTQIEILEAGVDISSFIAKIPIGYNDDITVILGTTINAIMGLIGSVFLAYTITGGVLWIMAGGSEDKVTRAKKFITGGITGMLVIFLAYTMVYFVVAALDFAAKGTT